MTLQECYAALEGDYQGVLGRLTSERMVQKFVLKFLNDGSYDLLLRSMAEENWQEAFRAAHTIKGVCQNLDFTRLYRSSSQLSEALRNGFTPEAPALAEQVKEDYARTTAAIRAFQESAGA
ncbi:MAG: Hpt domain-containing protein [Oscillospiraceae bacterium]|jgi:HPt (histidine-containing phosphotransfer) domain-containing protein|nr:Hpt domain-containing protein [Oscillospiraceae bacterium]MCI8720363.1 Hpt domain-containing protein [Oscillospiraceae bacterium]MCI8943575.1 Hpt domain-containing protein [Oscillospiraceae bacterium]